MRVADFDYHLPPSCIAQTPAGQRDRSRLLVLHRRSGALEHRAFADLADYLCPEDCLVLNDTRVIPARLIGRRGSGGRVELLLLRRRAGRTWEALARPGRRARPGSVVEFGEGELRATVTQVLPDGVRLVRLDHEGELRALLDRLGRTPLPPYVKRDADRPEDRERYQTVYARYDGAVAAPTAGLHFTEELLARIRNVGVEVVFLTLHVGLGTFKPVEVEVVEEHQMHGEQFRLPPEAAAAINARRARGGRIAAVGTTVVRALESAAGPNGQIVAGEGTTDLFIRPGHQFRAVDVLVTNFHLPRSTLIMLVSAFAGRERVLAAYEEAIRRGYRFYSYGDAMLIV